MKASALLNIVCLIACALASGGARADVAACPQAPAAMAQALLQGAADGSVSFYTDEEACWKEGSHPLLGPYERRRPSGDGRLAAQYVDERRPFQNVVVERADGEGAPRYVARFQWRVVGTGGARLVPDSASFYMDPSRSYGGCAVIVDAPMVPAIKRSCARQVPSRR